MDTECKEKHSWDFQLEETWFSPLVGRRICVLRNTLCLRLEFGVEALGSYLPLIVRCTDVKSLYCDCAVPRPYRHSGPVAQQLDQVRLRLQHHRRQH
eukprot:4307784-Pyramimonas_sp.AAC.2